MGRYQFMELEITAHIGGIGVRSTERVRLMSGHPNTFEKGLLLDWTKDSSALHRPQLFPCCLGAITRRSIGVCTVLFPSLRNLLCTPEVGAGPNYEN